MITKLIKNCPKCNNVKIKDGEPLVNLPPYLYNIKTILITCNCVNGRNKNYEYIIGYDHSYFNSQTLGCLNCWNIIDEDEEIS